MGMSDADKITEMNPKSNGLDGVCHRRRITNKERGKKKINVLLQVDHKKSRTLF